MEKEFMFYTSVLILVVFCTAMFVVGLWAVDIGVSGVACGGVATNGWWTRDPVQQYHIGLWLSFMSTLTLALVSGVLVCFGLKK